MNREQVIEILVGILDACNNTARQLANTIAEAPIKVYCPLVDERKYVQCDEIEFKKVAKIVGNEIIIKPACEYYEYRMYLTDTYYICCLGNSPECNL